MRKSKKGIALGMFLVFAILLIGLTGLVSAYLRSSPQFTQYQSQDLFGGVDVSSLEFDEEMCQAGQDFIVQIAPFGCEPAVVRDDLLEEQNVPVFCQLAATKINPLIDVEAIDSLIISGQNLSSEIAGVGFQPAQAALGTEERLNSPILDNIGYAVIVLKKQPNSTAIPEYVEGELSAKMKYDIENAFGIGQASYYLPVLTDNEWEEQKTKYSFWNSRGYLRAEEIEGEEAVISIYDDIKEIDSVRVSEGEKSRRINLPGFACYANLVLELDDLKSPDTRARLRVNDDYIEAAEGETFLQDKCVVDDIEKYGLVQKATIRCKEDDNSKLISFGSSFDLFINPKVEIQISGEENPREVSVGEKLYSSADTHYYLGYAGTKHGTGKEEDLEIVVIGLNREVEKLEDEDLNYVYSLVKAARVDEGGTLGSMFVETGEFYIGATRHIVNYMVGKRETDFVSVGDDPKEFGDKKISLIGFGQLVDQELSDEVKEYYDLAIEDYDFIIENFGFEKVIDYSVNPPIELDETYGERAFYEKIKFLERSKKFDSIDNVCDEFEDKYPESKLYKQLKTDKICVPSAKTSNPEAASSIVFVNGKSREVSLDGIYEPSFKEFGAEILIRPPNGAPYTVRLGKNEIFGKGEEQFIQLIDAEEDAAKLKVSFENQSAKERLKQYFVSTKTFRKNVPQQVGDYVLTLTNVNVEQVAKVSVVPNINNVGGEANFSFKIGIEKRNIQLSPGKTKQIINTLNDSIEEWSEKANKLGNFTQNMKKACLGVGAALIVKNFFANIGGKGIARQEVMDHWNGKCANAVSTGKLDGNSVDYQSTQECFLDNAATIENTVNNYANRLEAQNAKMERLQQGITTTTGPLGEKRVNTEELEKKYLEELDRDKLKSDLKSKFGSHMIVGNDNVSIDQFVDDLNEKGVTVSELRDLEFKAGLTGGGLDEISKDDLRTSISEIYTSTKEINAITKAEEGAKNELGIPIPYTSGEHEKTRHETYKAHELSSDEASKIIGLKEGSKVQGYTYKGRKYILELTRPEEKGDYSVGKVFDSKGNEVNISKDSIASEIKSNVLFKEYDSKTYNNVYNNPKLQYFETGAYEGKPSIVPFDIENGWYVAVKQTLPTGRNIQAYDKSGRVSSFYLCNVGENHIQEFYSGSRDDICQMINLNTGQPYNQFPGLSKTEAAKKVKDAIQAVEEASQKHEPGISGKIKILGNIVEIGAPAADLPQMQCQNFMSVRDCQILFNVCDPVVCPSSRCNLGGAYPVKDVVQTGIIGGLVLCLPNFQNGVYIPLCLTGIQAGIEGLVSVYTSYRDCLQESLDTGQMVGICDEIYSVHLCEFFWRQAAPLAEVAIPKLVGALFGKGAARGGGEYLTVQNAWESASNSLDVFTSYYGASSFAAFKARSTEAIGSLFCKNFISGVGPETGNILDQLTKPDSPPQFHGRFEIIPYTTTTSPPTSQYKVFYHIYSGQGSRAVYKVYLKAPTSGSYYQDIGSDRIVAQGYVAAGDYASETVDFTGPTGYNELCINVNGQEECGFKTVSTSFAFNTLEDKYKQEQLTETDITSEADCVSGTTSAYSLLSPSAAGALEEAVNPAIYNRGIIRICSSENPGKGSDPLIGTKDERWKQVGNCGDSRIKCWLDTSTINDIIKNTDIQKATLSELEDKSIEVLKDEGKWVADFEGEYKRIRVLGADEVIEEVEKLYSKVFYHRQKASLLLLRTNSYTELLIYYKTIEDVEQAEKERVERGPLFLGEEKKVDLSETPITDYDSRDLQEFFEKSDEALLYAVKGESTFPMVWLEKEISTGEAIVNFFVFNTSSNLYERWDLEPISMFEPDQGREWIQYTPAYKRNDPEMTEIVETLDSLFARYEEYTLPGEKEDYREYELSPTDLSKLEGKPSDCSKCRELVSTGKCTQGVCEEINIYVRDRTHNVWGCEAEAPSGIMGDEYSCTSEELIDVDDICDKCGDLGYSSGGLVGGIDTGCDSSGCEESAEEVKKETAGFWTCTYSEGKCVAAESTEAEQEEFVPEDICSDTCRTSGGIVAKTTCPGCSDADEQLRAETEGKWGCKLVDEGFQGQDCEMVRFESTEEEQPTVSLSDLGIASNTPIDKYCDQCDAGAKICTEERCNSISSLVKDETNNAHSCRVRKAFISIECDYV